MAPATDRLAVPLPPDLLALSAEQFDGLLADFMACMREADRLRKEIQHRRAIRASAAN